MYGPPQHESGAPVDLRFQYGEPNHDVEPTDPQVAERLGYADPGLRRVTDEDAARNSSADGGRKEDDGDDEGNSDAGAGGDSTSDGDRTTSPELLA